MELAWCHCGSFMVTAWLLCWFLTVPLRLYCGNAMLYLLLSEPDIPVLLQHSREC